MFSSIVIEKIWLRRLAELKKKKIEKNPAAGQLVHGESSLLLRQNVAEAYMSENSPSTFLKVPY